MRVSFVVVMLSMSSCTGTRATPPGPLPVKVKRTGEPVHASATFVKSWEALVPVCGAMPFAPAVMKVKWESRAHEKNVWMSEVSAELVSPGEALEVTVPGEVEVGGAALEAGAPWVDVASVAVKCERETFKFPKKYEQKLVSVVQVKADGFVSVDGRGWASAQ